MFKLNTVIFNEVYRLLAAQSKKLSEYENEIYSIAADMNDNEVCGEVKAELIKLSEQTGQCSNLLLKMSKGINDCGELYAEYEKIITDKCDMLNVTYND